MTPSADDLLKRQLIETLYTTQGQVTMAAELLGVSRRTIARRMRQFKVDRRRWKEFAPPCGVCRRRRGSDEGFICWNLVGPNGVGVAELRVCGGCYELPERRELEVAMKKYAEAAIERRRVESDKMAAAAAEAETEAAKAKEGEVVHGGQP